MVRIALFLLCLLTAEGLTTVSNRRGFLAAAAALATPVCCIGPTAAAGALDMDAFVNKELANETCDEKLNKKCAPKLSDDEALCRYGFPSKTTGEACVRAGMSTKRSGNLDAFGKVERGDYVRCKTFYEDTGKEYVRKTVCE